MTLQNKIWMQRIRNLPTQEEIQEDHMIGKTVFVSTKKGNVTKEVGDNATGEVYEVEFEDGTTEEIPVSNMELATTESCNNQNPGCESVQKEEEDELEEDKGEEYEKFFKAALKKFGADSPADLEGEKKKEFFDYVDKNWKGEKKESFEFSTEELAHFESILKKIDEAKDYRKDLEKRHAEAIKLIWSIDTSFGRTKWTDSFGNYVTNKMPDDIDTSIDAGWAYHQARGRGEWFFIMEPNDEVKYSYTGDAKIPTSETSGRMKIGEFKKFISKVWALTPNDSKGNRLKIK